MRGEGSINNHNAQRYVDNMEKLIREYPHVTFVFMTGHAEGQGEELNPNGVHYNNQLIRQHCRDNRRILFDQTFNNVAMFVPEVPTKVDFSDSGYQPSDGYPYEYYPEEHEDGPPPIFTVDICIPVKPL